MRLTIILMILSGMIIQSCTRNNDTQIHDIVIIGGGLMGSATAWHLSNSGLETMLLEKQDSVYNQGSSMGDARIARSNNRGDDIWSFLHNRSVHETEKLIAHLNTTTEESTFLMEDLYTTSPVTYVGRIGIYDRLLASLERQKVDYEMATTPKEALDLFDVELPENILIQREYNRYSGTVNPQRLIRYLHRAIQSLNGTISYQSRVSKLAYDAENDCYSITYVNESTHKEQTILSKKVVSAAGPYTGSLLKDVAPYFEELITPQRIFLAFYSIKKEAFADLTPQQVQKIHEYYPVINSSKGGRMGSFFSMIEYHDEEGRPIIKIGGHFQRSDIEDLDDIWTKELSEEEEIWSRNSTVRYLKSIRVPVSAADLKLEKGYSCVYSLTETEVPYVTPIIEQDRKANPNVIVLGGMSGVGAKGAMTYGLIAADMITGRQDVDSMYHVTRKRLGFERLLQDVDNLTESEK